MEYLNKRYPGIGFFGIILGIFLFFVFGPLYVKTGYGIEFGQLCLVVILVATLYLVGHRKNQLVIASFFAIPFLLLDFYSIWTRDPYHMAVSYIFFCLFLAYAILLLGKYAIVKRHIDTNLIFAVITLYILSGMLWGKLYFLQDFVFPESFTGIPLRETNTDLKAAVENQFDFLYYSFSILTTLGLGDIAPKHHFARSLTVSEAIFGQLFVAIVIAKMVSSWRNE
jgi:Ca2+/Na+ antiporter